MDQAHRSDAADRGEERVVVLYQHQPAFGEGRRVGRGQRDLGGGLRGHRPDAHLLVQSDLGVPALKPIEADDASVGVFRETGSKDAGGFLSTFDNHGIPVVEVERGHQLGVNTDDPSPNVLGFRFQDPKELVVFAHGFAHDNVI